VGRRAAVVASLRPASAGVVRIEVGGAARQGRSVSFRLDTAQPGRLRVHVSTVAAAGWAAPRKTLDVAVVFPDLGPGSSGASVRELEQRLAALHYALLGIDASFGQDTVDALYAFQKVQGLPRTGHADRVEVDKGHQVLYVVRGGKVALIVPVSTGGSPEKFTPVGTFSVYRKVTGYDPSPLGTLYDPSYFTGGYAIHGNPSVPPYPASHGCVRVPMWVAARLYASMPYGEPVVVY
jgi:lipoprotein-anchoring transpeptidase ErfK/SrfK